MTWRFFHAHLRTSFLLSSFSGTLSHFFTVYTLWPPALGGCGAAVLVEDSVASVLADVTQALLPRSHTECCELIDNAALKVCSPFASARVYTILFCMVLVVIGVKTTAALLARGSASMRVGARCNNRIVHCVLCSARCTLPFSRT